MAAKCLDFSGAASRSQVNCVHPRIFPISSTYLSSTYKCTNVIKRKTCTLLTPTARKTVLTMSLQQVQTRGIYHCLPVYPASQTGLTAIITGANGISGYYMLKVLAEAPERWTKIYCLSRRPPAIKEGLPKNAEHIALDFLNKPEEIAAVLKEKGIRA